MTLAVLLTAHFVGDFILQSDWMAGNKSKRWDALLLHTSIYAACFAYWGVWFVLITFLTHTATDYVTSRINSRLWFLKLTLAGKRWRELAPGVASETPAYYVDDTGTRHWFFVGIGADQLIHVWTLALTALWLGL